MTFGKGVSAMKKNKHIAIVLLILWIIIYLSTDLFFNILGCFESLVIETAFGTVHLFLFYFKFSGSLSLALRDSSSCPKGGDEKAVPSHAFIENYLYNDIS